MTLCTNCGVEVEDGTARCPLCRTPLAPGIPPDLAAPLVPRRGTREASRRIRRWVLEALSVFALTGAVVVFAADFATGWSITWARYPLAAIAYLWLASALLVLSSSRPWLVLTTEIAAADLFLLTLDRLTPGASWFLPVALPVTLLIASVLALMLTVVRRRLLSPFAVIATALLAGGLIVVGLELLLNHHFAGRWSVGWSAVVFACLLPIVALLLYLRTWLRARQSELRKLLHI